MTIQEIFDKVATHLLTQMKISTGRISHDLPVACKYRGDNGLMCAVGCLIPDELYDPVIEGLNSFALFGSVPKLKHAILSDDAHSAILQLNLIRDLQEIHDLREVPTWKDALVRLAKVHGLDAGVCKSST